MARTTVGYDRVYSSATSSVIGQIATSHTISQIANGGFYTQPLRIPENLDTTKPVSVRILAVPAIPSSGGVRNVRFQLAYTVIDPGGPIVDTSVPFDYTTPDNWSNDDPRYILIDDGSGSTIPTGLLLGATHLGLRIARNGADPADTFDKLIKIAHALTLDYTAI